MIIEDARDVRSWVIDVVIGGLDADKCGWERVGMLAEVTEVGSVWVVVCFGVMGLGFDGGEDNLG